MTFCGRLQTIVWREKMGRFVGANPTAAEKLVAELQEGGKFQVGKFTPEQRQKFHAKLRPYVEVTPEDLMLSVDYHLSNVAIQAEIQTAVETYDRARQFLSGINAR